MKRVNRGKKRIDTIFVLMIFGIFAMSVLMVLMLGAGIYRNISNIIEDKQDEHILLSYIWTKVKSNDRYESIRIGEYFGLQALCIDEPDDDTCYTTAIYLYDGWVYELFTETELLEETDPDMSFAPDDGIRIMRISDIFFEKIEYGLIRITAGTETLLIYPRGS